VISDVIILEENGVKGDERERGFISIM